jgi:anti-sigma factor RsiW
MNHLTQNQLNEYVDGVLPPALASEMENHLSGCTSCRSELDALGSVFKALAKLPEESPSPSLLSSILKDLSVPHIGPVWRAVLAIQAGIGIGVFILIGRLATEVLHANLDIWSALATWTGLLARIFSLFPSLVFHPWSLPASQASMPLPATIILLAVVLIVCGLGTSRLLRNGSSANE